MWNRENDRALAVVCIQKIISSSYGQIEFNSIRVDSIRSRFFARGSNACVFAQAHNVDSVDFPAFILQPQQHTFIGNGKNELSFHRFSYKHKHPNANIYRV